jgi:WD40 repeat protein
MGESDVWFFSDLGFIMIFDVAERTYHDLGVIAKLPDAFNNNSYAYKSISPNGDYMYVTRGGQSPTDPQIYLVDLRTFESQLYPVSSMHWSANGKYAELYTMLLTSTDGEYSTKYQVLTLSDKTLRSFPTDQEDAQNKSYWIASGWHPSDSVRLSIFADDAQHIVVDVVNVEALARQSYEFSLPFNFDGAYYTDAMSIIWNPENDHFAFNAADGSIWQMDYPKFENLEQLTPSMENVKDISWSPDGQYLSFISGADIYIVDIASKP